MPSEGGIQKLAIKASPSVKWNIRNSDYVDWIEIVDGDSGTGPGTITVKLGANSGKSCRVGVLTIAGPAQIFGTPMRIGSPVRILQRGIETATAGAGEQKKSSLPSVINLTPFSGGNPQPGTGQYEKVVKK